MVAVVDTGFEVTHPDLAGQFTGNPDERGGGRGDQRRRRRRQRHGSTTGRAGTSSTATTRSRPRATSTARTSPGRSRRSPTTASASPASPRWRRCVPVKIFGGAELHGLVERDRAGVRLRRRPRRAGGQCVARRAGNVDDGHQRDRRAPEHALRRRPRATTTPTPRCTIPCNADAANVVCVGASDNRDQPADFSNWSPTAVDLYAPGWWILSTTSAATYSYANGTSMAAPHVAGVAALLAAAEPGTTRARAQDRAAVVGRRARLARGAGGDQRAAERGPRAGRSPARGARRHADAYADADRHGNADAEPGAPTGADPGRCPRRRRR